MEHLYGPESERVCRPERANSPPLSEICEHLNNAAAIAIKHANLWELFRVQVNFFRECYPNESADPLDDYIDLWISCSETDKIFHYLTNADIITMRQLLKHPPVWFKKHVFGIAEASMHRIAMAQQKFLQSYPNAMV